MLPVEGSIDSLSGIPTGSTSGSAIPKLLEGAKLAFVLALRQAFQCSLTHEALRYNSDQEQTKIKIYTAHPLKPEFFPALIVSSTSGDMSIRYMGDDFTDEDISEGKIKYDGQLSFSISVTVQSKSTLERERIIDHLIFYIRHLFRDVLHGFNLEYTKNIRVGAENISEVENVPVYEQTIDVPCYLEYHSVIDQGSLATLRKIDIADIQTISIE